MIVTLHEDEVYEVNEEDQTIGIREKHLKTRTKEEIDQAIEGLDKLVKELGKLGIRGIRFAK